MLHFRLELAAYLIKNLVDEPTGVDVQVFEGEKSTVVEIRVADPDVAKVVGRKGQTIKALRTISMTVSARVGRRVRLEVVN